MGLLLQEIRSMRKRKRREKSSRYLQCRNLSDFERLAKELLAEHRFYYYNYKAGEGITSLLTRIYFDQKLLIIPRVLSDLNEISLKTNFFG